jgi:hypothetical protein
VCGVEFVNWDVLADMCEAGSRSRRNWGRRNIAVESAAKQPKYSAAAAALSHVHADVALNRRPANVLAYGNCPRSSASSSRQDFCSSFFGSGVK